MLITEIQVVAPVHDDDDDEMVHEKVVDVRVISVSNFSAEKKCPMCKKGNVKLRPEQPAEARSSSCRTIRRLLSCTAVTTCELTLETTDCAPLFCTAYEDVLSEIAQLPLKDVDEVKLLLADPFDVFLKHGSITKVERSKSFTPTEDPLESTREDIMPRRATKWPSLQ